MTSTKQIPISRACLKDESELEDFLVEENKLQVCSTDKDESKGILVNESSTDEGESECAHKNINREKDTKNES